jgi:gas vesicle protein
MGKNTGKWAAGALLAGAVGYLAGILTAPKSGKETREDIKNAATKAKTEAEKKLKEVHSELNTRINDLKDKGSELSGKAKDEFSELMDKARSAKEKVREVLSSLHDGDAEDPELQKALTDAKTALKHLEKFVKSK